MQPETLFKQRVMRDLREMPGVWLVKTQQVAVRGIPDLLVCIHGRFVALELKRSEEAAIDKLQLWHLEKILAAGGISYVVFPENWPRIRERLAALTPV